MGATHIIRLPMPDGTFREVPIDSATPEGADLLNDPAVVQSGDVRVLDAQGQQEIARRQRIDRSAREMAEDPSAAGLGMRAVAAGAGAIDELTLGRLSEGIREFGSPHLQESMEAMRQGLSEDYGGGRILGTIVPALLSGGESLAAQSGSRMARLARFAPSGFSAQAGNLVRDAVGTRLLRAGVGPGMSRALGTGAGAVADGALAGALETVTESNISGTPIDGERFLSNSLFGAMLGLGAGAPAAIGEGGFAAIRGARSRAALRQLEEAGVATRVPDGMPVIDDLSTVPGPAQVADGPLHRLLRQSPAVNQNPNTQRAFDIYAANPELASDLAGWTATTREFAQDMTAFRDLLEQGGRRVLVASERGAAIAEAASRSGADSVGGALGPITEAVRELDTALAPGDQFAQRIREVVGPRLRDELGQILEQGEALASPGDLAQRLDRLIEELPSARSLANDPDGSTLIATVRNQLLSAQEALGGRAARTIRESVSELQSVRRDLGVFGRETEGGFVWDGGRLGDELSTSAFRVGGRNTELLDDYFRAADSVLEQAEGAGSQEAARARARLRELTAQTRALREWGQAIGAYRLLTGEESTAAGIQAAIGNKGGVLIGGLVGSAIGGPLGAATGVLGAIAGHPVGFVRTMAGLKRMLGASDQRMATGLRKVRSSLSSSRLVRGSRSAGIGGRAVVRTALKLRDPESRAEEYDAVVEQVRTLVGNPQAMVDRVGLVTENLASVHPNAAAVASQSMVAGLHHLADNLPPVSLPSPFPGQKQRRPSFGEMEDFVRRYEAIEDPFILLDRIADGSLTAAHVEAVNATYPRLLQAIRAEITTIMGDLQTLPPYTQRSRLGLLLGAPVDPTLDQRFIGAMQQTYAQTSEQNRTQLGTGPSATMSMRVSDNTSTKASSITYGL